MSSLAELPLLAGFFSYSREDDEDSGGRLSQLRQRIKAELRGQLGRTKDDFDLFQDKIAIAHGKLWEEEIKSAIAEAVFFIPIITPTAVRSEYCKFEFDAFLAREKELGRNDLVFPIIYIPVPALEDGRWREDPLLAIIGRRQYEQWQHLRHVDATSTEFSLRIEKSCANIAKAMRRSWVSPQERQKAEARQRNEEERRQQEILRQAEARRREEEQRTLEEERRRAAKEEERRRRSEKQPQHLLGVGAPKRGRWRAIGAAAALLLLAAFIGLWVVSQQAARPPDSSGADNARAAATAARGEEQRKAQEAAAKAAADAEAKRKAEEAEQERLAAAKAAADAEAKRKAEEAEQERLAAAKAAADAEAKRKAEEAEQERLAAAKAAADAEAKRKAEEAEQERLAAAKAAADAEAKRKAEEAEQQPQAEKQRQAAAEQKATLGFTFADMSDDLRKRYKIKNTVRGVVVTSWLQRSIFGRFGFTIGPPLLEPGDVIVQIDGQRVASADDLQAKIDRLGSAAGRLSARLLVANAKGDTHYLQVP